MPATKVADRVYMLDTLALGNPGTVSAYVIKGPKPALVDCGYASSHQTVLDGLAELGLSPADMSYVIPTHVHLDHAGAAGHLMRAMPGARMVAHERAVPHLVDPSRLVESATKVFGSAIMALYGAPLPVEAGRITAVGKEMSLDLGGGLTATLVHAPGHAPHQVSVLLDSQKALLTADAVGIVYPGLGALIPTTPPPSFDPETLAHTVGQLEQTSPARLLVPHFGARDDPGHVFEETKSKVAQWVKDVRELRARGAGLDEASAAMEAKVREHSTAKELPIYAKVSVRTSVMGILHYLEKNP